MGFGRWIGGAILGVGTILAAPVILPVAAASAVTTTAGMAVVSAVATGASVAAAGAAAAAPTVSKFSEAKDIQAAAIRKYDQAREHFEARQAHANQSLEELGAEKLKVWALFERFDDMYSKIQNPPTLYGDFEGEHLTFTTAELRNVRAVAIDAKKLLTGGTIAGLASSSAANCAAAALGGSMLSATGLAGGTAMIAGLSFLPVLAVGGILLHSQARKSLETAKDIQHESEQAILKLQEAEIELEHIEQLSQALQQELSVLHQLFVSFIGQMERIVSKKSAYTQFTETEKKTLEKTILTLKLIKLISMQKILDSEDEHHLLEQEARKSIKTSQDTRQKNLSTVFSS